MICLVVGARVDEPFHSRSCSFRILSAFVKLELLSDVKVLIPGCLAVNWVIALTSALASIL